MNLIYDERCGMVAVYKADEKYHCLDLPDDSFIFVKHFPTNEDGKFIRDNEACNLAKMIAASYNMYEALEAIQHWSSDARIPCCFPRNLLDKALDKAKPE